MEVPAVSQQRRTAAHDPGIDRPHHEGTEPGLEIAIEHRQHGVGMVARVVRTRPVGIEQERIL